MAELPSEEKAGLPTSHIDSPPKPPAPASDADRKSSEIEKPDRGRNLDRDRSTPGEKDAIQDAERRRKHEHEHEHEHPYEQPSEHDSHDDDEHDSGSDVESHATSDAPADRVPTRSSTHSRAASIVPRTKRRGLLGSLTVVPEVDRPYDYSRKTKWMLTCVVSLAGVAAPLGSSIFYRTFPPPSWFPLFAT